MKAFATSLFLLLCCAGQLLADEARPNIVMIISDDHAWGDYSFMGHSHIATPRIDQLASQSLTFRRGYVPSSLCCPSLATIITGLYPHQHLVTSNDPPLPAGVAGRRFHQSPEFAAGREVMNRHLEAVPTLPRMLGELGYRSFQSGKWWQGNFRRGGFTHGMTKGERHGDEGLDIGRKTMQPIYDFIDQSQDDGTPFFVWYAPMMPHDPHTPPERLFKKYQSVAPSEHVARYWAMVEWFDETVGALVDHLDERGLSKDTIVVYVADNGWIQNVDRPRYAPKSKQSQYDGGVRTPIMIRWPGHVSPRMSDELAISIDLAPTLLAAVGKQPTPAMQGINLLDEAAVRERRAVYGECFTHNANDLNEPAANLRWRWMVEGPWKLIVPDAKNEPDAVVELYNLADDPHEETNLATKDATRSRKPCARSSMAGGIRRSRRTSVSAIDCAPRSLVVELLDADIAPPHFARLGFGADAVNLQGDETAGRHVVFQIGRRHAVDPGLDRVAPAFDAIVIPLAGLERLAGRFVLAQVVQPAAATFVVDAAAPGAGRGVDFNLVAMHAAGGNRFLEVSVLDVGRLVKALAANLHARVELGVNFEVQFENEVAVVLGRAEKRVAGVGHAGADDRVVFDAVLCLAPFLHPTIERLAVEQRLALLGQECGGQHRH